MMVTAKANASANGKMIEDGYRLNDNARYSIETMIMSGMAAFFGVVINEAAFFGVVINEAALPAAAPSPQILPEKNGVEKNAVASCNATSGLTREMQFDALISNKPVTRNARYCLAFPVTPTRL